MIPVRDSFGNFGLYFSAMVAPKLKRTLSVPLLTLYGLGNILGAGIYVLVGKVAGASGAHAPLSFLIAMVIAALTAFSYMELSSRFPKSAGSALYTFKALKSRLISLLVGISMILAGITSAAALSQGFAGYLDSIVSVPTMAASVAVLLLLTAVALLGISESARVAAFFTIVEATGLIAIVWLGRSQLANVSVGEVVSVSPDIGLSGLLFGAFLAFYAFIGFEDMVNVSEEVKNPRRAMPQAIFGSLAIATVLYMLVVLVSVAAVVPDRLAESSAPLSLVLQNISSIDPRTISVIGMAAAFNGIIVQIIMGSRMLYGMATQGWVSKRFARVNAKRHTPVTATIFVGLLMVIGTAALPLVSLAQATSYLVLLIFCLVNISLIILKMKKPPAKDIVQVPMALPVLGAISSIGVVLYQIAVQ